MPDTEKLKGALLMHVAEKENPGDQNSTIRKNGGAGYDYAADLAKIEFERFPFQRVMRAPTKIAEDTVRALGENANRLVWLNPKNEIIKSREIHTDRLTEWGLVAEKIRNSGAKPTLAALRAAENSCIQEHQLDEKGLIAPEAERLFAHIRAAVDTLSKGSTLLCVMHSPLPEAVILWLNETMPHELFSEWRGLENFPLLYHLDGYLLAFDDQELRHAIFLNHRRAVARGRFQRREEMQVLTKAGIEVTWQ